MKNKALIAASVSVAVLSAAASASAADLVHKSQHTTTLSKVASIQAPVYSWTGAYAGVNAGFDAVSVKQKLKKDEEETLKDLFKNPKGFLGGVYAGYNMEVGGDIVVGAETDFNMTVAKGKKDAATVDKATTPSSEISQKWAGATRARVGYSLDSFMPYVAAGVAYTAISPKVADRSIVKDEKKSENLIGWTAGGGLDYALTDNVLLRAEYRFSDYGTFDYKDAAKSDAAKKLSLKTNDVRVGVAYKF